MTYWEEALYRFIKNHRDECIKVYVRGNEHFEMEHPNYISMTRHVNMLKNAINRKCRQMQGKMSCEYVASNTEIVENIDEAFTFHPGIAYNNECGYEYQFRRLT